MTDDTDTDAHEDERAVSLPLIDTFAALTAELDAKTDRIERLESELDRRYLDPDGDPEPDDAPADESTDETETRSHEDWDPATDPLEDTGAATADGDHEGVRPTVDTAAGASHREEPTADAESAQSAHTDEASRESGLSPVKTASASDASSTEASEGATDEAFGVTMESSSDLTGGSLGSSAPIERSAPERDDATDGDGQPPDPTADRGERLSRLVRRAELRAEGEVVEAFVEGIDALDEVTRAMLAHYREVGDATPLDAHVAAGGSGERQYAYARNRTLRKAGVIEHDGAGRYRYALPDLVAEAFDGNAAAGTVEDAVDAIENATDLT
ncbi:hypothetical protein [Halolamina sp. C58]|uniref:hypothetical protein n=1 Tax=Halolamina sp. C58 TaxID=3421640 RepID=UPI003EBF2E6D